MRVVVALAWAAASAGMTASCAERTNSTGAGAATAAGVAESQAVAETPSERARELVQEAEIQIRDLEDIRAASPDVGTKESIDHQIVAVSRYRDAVLADLGQPPSPRLEADAANLRRAMEAAGAAQPQTPEPPPIQRLDRPPGGQEALPPAR